MKLLLANDAFDLFAVCYLILVLKMMALGSYTSLLRIRKRIFATAEDYAFQGLDPSIQIDEDVERVRRAHRNDLENVLPFFGAGLLYSLSDPSGTGAAISFVGFAVARVLHGVFYVLSLQPWRTIAFGVGYVLLLWMALVGVVSFAGRL